MQKNVHRYSAYFPRWCQAFGDHTPDPGGEGRAVEWLISEDSVGLVVLPEIRRILQHELLGTCEPHLELISPMLANLLSQMPIGIPPFSEQFNEDSPQACDPIKISLWNRDEVGTSSGVQPSPQLSSQLCWESNILYTGDESVLASKVGQHVNTGVLTSDPLLRTNGWLNVGMAVQAYQYHPAFPITAAFPLHTWFFRYPDSVCLSGGNGPPVPVDQCVNYPGFVPGDSIPDGPVDEFLVQLGMPYLGFAIKERGFGQAASYAALWDHSYLRSYEARNAVGGVPPSFFESIFGSGN